MGDRVIHVLADSTSRARHQLRTTELAMSHYSASFCSRFRAVSASRLVLKCGVPDTRTQPGSVGGRSSTASDTSLSSKISQSLRTRPFSIFPASPRLRREYLLVPIKSFVRTKAL